MQAERQAMGREATITGALKAESMRLSWSLGRDLELSRPHLPTTLQKEGQGALWRHPGVSPLPSLPSFPAHFSPSFIEHLLYQALSHALDVR